jgi:hypothetical protein
MSSQPPKPEFVVFVTNCEYSKNFLNKLNTKQELARKFNVVDINKIEIVPDEIDEVPCVYDGKELHQGKDAFKWLNEKLADHLDAANDGLMYSFIDGNDERVFGNYSLIEQKNGSHGMGEQASSDNMNDPTRMAKLSNNDNKNRTLDSLMASRSAEIKPN